MATTFPLSWYKNVFVSHYPINEYGVVHGRDIDCLKRYITKEVGFVSEFSDVRGSEWWCGTNFRRMLERMIGETVSIHTNETDFTGKLADVETTFVTLASHRKSASAHVSIVYLPIRHINAVTDI